ncbi:phosphotransferase [Thiomicrorhabdus aquaedulcis]|uniref:phosphotransferase n=1 Tax=Thiomicrorhabdus aquaedulcis TaxID=2211106 RepID=UPI001561E67B|nr:phosphotransferase [Thiomicrorhabdus aquaedulcis]
MRYPEIIVLCRQIKEYLAVFFGLRKRSNQLKTKLQLASGETLDKIINTVEISLQELGILSDNSRFEDLGGANNLGFLLHRTELKKLTWVTKFAYSEEIAREDYFLQWHQKNVLTQHAIAPVLKVIGVLGDSNVRFMTMEALNSPNKISFAEIVELYVKLQSVGELFIRQHHNANGFPKMTGGSRIRDLLLTLICQFGTPSSQQYIQVFFDQRKKINPLHSKEIEVIQEKVEKYLVQFGKLDESMIGLVHGDYKAANMMRDNYGNLKLVDFQYYQVGVRVWDLAFFMSKQKKHFDIIYYELKSLTSFSVEENRLLILCFILAAMLHLTPSTFKYKYKFHISPALNKLQRDVQHKECH